jgi:hypothetical protein
VCVCVCGGGEGAVGRVDVRHTYSRSFALFFFKFYIHISIQLISYFIQQYAYFAKLTVLFRYEN